MSLHRVWPPRRAAQDTTTVLWRAALSTLFLNAYLRLHRNVKVEGPVFCIGWPPRIVGKGKILIGRGVTFRNMSTRTLIGASSASEGLTLKDGAFVNEGCSIVAHRKIVIDEGSKVGEYCGIFDTDHHEVDEGGGVRVAEVTIGKNVWLGRSVMVMPGVSVGHDSVVAAASVVTRSVPSRTLVAGNPATILRRVKVETHGWRRR